MEKRKGVERQGMTNEFIGKNLTPEIKANWSDYLEQNELTDFWEYTRDITRELFISGFFWGSDFRIRLPFIIPIVDKPLLFYIFRNNPNGKIVISDSGDTIRRIKTMKLKNSLTQSETKKILEIFEITGCRFQKDKNSAIVPIEIETKPTKIAINYLRLGQAILMIYGLFTKWLKQYREAMNLGVDSEEYQMYANHWDKLAYL